MMIVPQHIRDTEKMLDLVQKEFFQVSPKVFKEMDFKIKFSIFGDKKCCCGYLNCIEVECLMNEIENK